MIDGKETGQIGEMTVCRSKHCTTYHYVDDNTLEIGFIPMLISSGGESPDKEVNSSIEYFDMVSEESFKSDHKMIQGRHSHSQVVVGEWLYIIGGKDVDGNILNSIERFHLETFVKERDDKSFE